MKRSLHPLFFLILFCLPLIGAQAADEEGDSELTGRIGLGFSNLGPSQKEALSVDWQATQASSFEFNLALDTRSKNNYLQTGIRANRNLFIEKYQSYFLYFGGSLISQQVSGSNQNGYGLDGGLGARFFLANLPNLGFSFRFGLQLTSTSSTRFRTGVGFGAHYYF
jgi:hypothetical protein